MSCQLCKRIHFRCVKNILTMKHCVLSVILLASYAISLQIERLVNDKIFNVENCGDIDAEKRNKICTCSRNKSTLTSHPDETYYCKDLEELEENRKYLLFGIVYVTLITLLFVLVASLAPKIVFTTIFSSLLECCDFA